MKFEVRAEYACGHQSRIVASGDCNKPETLTADLTRNAGAEEEVNFNCRCGRGAAFVEIILDGRIISREPASAFLGVAGARLTKRPR